jgi:hypothetical protein
VGGGNIYTQLAECTAVHRRPRSKRLHHESADREKSDRPRQLTGSDLEHLGPSTLGSFRGRRNDMSQRLTTGITGADSEKIDHLTELSSWDVELPGLSTLSSCSSVGKE